MLTTDCRFQSWAQSTGTTWSALPRYYPPYICSVFLQKVNIFMQNCPGPTSTRNIKWIAAVFPSVSSTPSLRCGAVWDIASLYLGLSNYRNTFSLKGNISINLDTTLANCHPCSHRWDAVVHMETFDKDSQAILRSIWVNLIGRTHFDPDWQDIAWWCGK